MELNFAHNFKYFSDPIFSILSLHAQCAQRTTNRSYHQTAVNYNDLARTPKMVKIYQLNISFSNYRIFGMMGRNYHGRLEGLQSVGFVYRYCNRLRWWQHCRNRTFQVWETHPTSNSFFSYIVKYECVLDAKTSQQRFLPCTFLVQKCVRTLVISMERWTTLIGWNLYVPVPKYVKKRIRLSGGVIGQTKMWSIGQLS